jgi:N-acetylmuramic acid 6-phosphate etherase
LKKWTEASSLHRHLEKKSVAELLQGINSEDQKVAQVVADNLSSIEALVEAAVDCLLAGGRLFYLGAGTSGRLGILDASECPPTFGVPHDLVIGLIAGGDGAIRKAVEFAEDDPLGGWKDLQKHEVSKSDFIVGLAASGTTPYVVGALDQAQKHGIRTGCICCNEGSPVAAVSDFPIELVVGPEFVTGSTRMKSGTAQKMALNMISTACMIKLGRVEDNRMVDMALANNKLVDRGTRMVAKALDISEEEAQKRLLEAGSVREAIKRSQDSK